MLDGLSLLALWSEYAFKSLIWRALDKERAAFYYAKCLDIEKQLSLMS